MKDSSNIDFASLARFELGEHARITHIWGGQNLARRLLSLGLRIGSEVELLHRRGGGVVVLCNGNRIALGAGVCEKVQAELLNEPAEA